VRNAACERDEVADTERERTQRVEGVQHAAPLAGGVRAHHRHLPEELAHVAAHARLGGQLSRSAVLSAADYLLQQRDVSVTQRALSGTQRDISGTQRDISGSPARPLSSRPRAPGWRRARPAPPPRPRARASCTTPSGCRPPAVQAMGKVRIVTSGGFRVGDELTRPFRHARRFPSTRW
jgi:hypothetical protein